jgi:DNA-binding HxlR family transcriptional regulator
MIPTGPPRRFIELVSGRWTVAMLEQLADGGRRYQYLHDALGGVSTKFSLRRSAELNVTGSSPATWTPAA